MMQAQAINLTRLDNPALELIFSHLNYVDLQTLSQTCRSLRHLVSSAAIRTLNCTRSDKIPINLLPYAPDHSLLSQPDWRVLTYKAGRRKDQIYLSKLFWSSSFKYFNTLSLRNVILDGTMVNVLDIIYFISKAPHLAYISVRFCTDVNSLLLQNFLDSLATTGQVVNLERLDVIGIDGLPFFEPVNNGSFTFNEMEIELTGAGPEFDYQDRWREDMYDFKMSLERVSTTHGHAILTDTSRCSQGYCRTFSFGRKELADPTANWTLPHCTMCDNKWVLPLCRACIGGRTCKICYTFVCPACRDQFLPKFGVLLIRLGYNIDNDIELHDLSTSQRWMQTLTVDHARGGGAVNRNCSADIKLNCHGSPRAALMMQLTHKHMARMVTAKISLEEGWL